MRSAYALGGALEQEPKLFVALLGLEECVARLLGEGMKVRHRAGIGGNDSQHLAGRELLHGDACFDDRHGTQHAATVESLIGSDGVGHDISPAGMETGLHGES